MYKSSVGRFAIVALTQSCCVPCSGLEIAVQPFASKRKRDDSTENNFGSWDSRHACFLATCEKLACQSPLVLDDNLLGEGSDESLFDEGTGDGLAMPPPVPPLAALPAGESREHMTKDQSALNVAYDVLQSADNQPKSAPAHLHQKQPDAEWAELTALLADGKFLNAQPVQDEQPVHQNFQGLLGQTMDESVRDVQDGLADQQWYDPLDIENSDHSQSYSVPPPQKVLSFASPAAVSDPSSNRRLLIRAANVEQPPGLAIPDHMVTAFPLGTLAKIVEYESYIVF